MLQQQRHKRCTNNIDMLHRGTRVIDEQPAIDIMFRAPSPLDLSTVIWSGFSELMDKENVDTQVYRGLSLAVAVDHLPPGVDV